MPGFQTAGHNPFIGSMGSWKQVYESEHFKIKEEIIEVIVDEKFPKLGTDTKLQVQEVQRIP